MAKGIWLTGKTGSGSENMLDQPSPKGKERKKKKNQSYYICQGENVANVVVLAIVALVSFCRPPVTSVYQTFLNGEKAIKVQGRKISSEYHTSAQWLLPR